MDHYTPFEKGERGEKPKDNEEGERGRECDAKYMSHLLRFPEGGKKGEERNTTAFFITLGQEYASTGKKDNWRVGFSCTKGKRRKKGRSYGIFLFSEK